MCNLEFSSLSLALTTTLLFNVYHLHWHSLDLQLQKPFSLILFGMTGGGGQSSNIQYRCGKIFQIRSKLCGRERMTIAEMSSPLE